MNLVFYKNLKKTLADGNNMSKFEPLSIDGRIKREALIPRPLKHHSITDWDFQNVDWTLDEGIYHNAAPSLLGTGAYCHVLIKNATTGALSDGRLIFWTRTDGLYLARYPMFRNQDADGGASITNCYYFFIYSNKIELYRALDGDLSPIAQKNMTWTWSIDTWYKLRVTWWTSAERLYVRIERWTGTEWVTLGGDADTDFEDVNDRWKDSEVNRVGFLAGTDVWWDDVEVWG